MDESLVQFAQATLKVAYRRAELAPALPLGDPAWYILLDLFVSEFKGRRVAKSCACLASNVPNSTGLRILKRLVEAGYVSADRDPDDARRSLMRLTPLGLDFVIDNLIPELKAIHTER